jgi:hypothetical protein
MQRCGFTAIDRIPGTVNELVLYELPLEEVETQK